MSHRQEQEDPERTTTTIHAVPSSVNTTIARGAFGEIRLGLQIVQRPPTDHGSSHSNSAPSIRLVVLKQVLLERSSSTTENDNSNDNGNDNGNSADLDEITCLQQLPPHANIVPLLKSFTTNNRQNNHNGHNRQLWSLALPYCPVDLYTVLEWKRLTSIATGSTTSTTSTTTTTTRSTTPTRQQHGLLSVTTLHRLARHLFAALEHCHAHDIVHGDVKPGNLLIRVESARLLLCDFGIAGKQQQQNNNDDDDNDDHMEETATMENDKGNNRIPMDLSDYDGDDAAAIWMMQQQQQTKKRPKALCTLQYRPPEWLLGQDRRHPSMDLFSAGLVWADCLMVRNMALFSGGTNDLSQLSLYFDVLGTPHHPSSRLCRLPDWGKLEFAPRPHDPHWYWRRVPQLTEIIVDDNGNGQTNGSGSSSNSHPPETWASRIIDHTIRLDPDQRWSAQQCGRALEGATTTMTTTPTTTNKNDTIDIFLNELVPPSWQRPPLLLSSPPPNGSLEKDASHAVLHQQLVQLARQRRDFLSSLHPWNQFTQKHRSAANQKIS